MSDAVAPHAVENGPYRRPHVLDRPVEAPVIECVDLVHSFGSKAVLRGVSFQVPRGSVYGFIGPNGAGRRRRFASSQPSSIQPRARRG